MREARAEFHLWLQRAESELGAAHRQLMTPTPEGLEAVCQALESAGAAMASVRTTLAEQPAQTLALREALLKLQSQARLLAALLDHAAQFHLGWARLLAASVAGYTESGQPAPLAPPPTISLRG